MDADQVVRSAERRSPGLVRLALLLSPAVRIEQELMRAVRLELVPKLPAGTEGELWFSPLVSARGLDGVVLDAAVANLLRSRARAILLPAAGAPIQDDVPTRDDIRRAWCLIKQMHAASPPVLWLEERVNWLAVSEASPETGIEAELQLAVEALRRGRTGVARWAARALPRMPDAARSTTAAWLLAQGAGRRLASREWGTRAPDIGRIDDLAALLPPRYDVPLGVRLLGDRLDIGDVGRDGVSIRVLDTDPRVLAVSTVEGKDEQIIQVRKGARVSVNAGTGPVRLRTPRGEIYRVQAAEGGIFSQLRDSYVSVQPEGAGERARAMGIAVASDRVLTVLSPQEIRSVVTITGPSGIPVPGQVTAAEEVLTLLAVTQLPPGVRPMSLPSARPSPPRVGDRWYGLTFGADGAWRVLTGEITAVRDDGALVAAPDVPGERPIPGSPVIVDGVLSGLITFQTSEGLYAVETAAVADLLGLGPEPDRLPDLTSAAQAIALEFHMRLRGFSRGSGIELDTDALMAAAGLTGEQFDHVRGAAEHVITEGIEARIRPRWLESSDSSRFSAAAVAALDKASEALRSPGRRQQSFTLSRRRFSLTAAAQQALAEIGVALVPSTLGGVDAELDADRFIAGGWRRLRGILADELPGFDEWDPWSQAPAAGADRPQVLLEVVSALCRSGPGVPEPARTVLEAADSHLYPRWWQVRDDLVRVGVPDVGADQDFPDFLEAYLGWCLTVLHQVGTSAGSYRYDMGYTIPRSDATTLPAARFGLDTRPARQDTEILLAGRFAALVGFSAWVFLELADQVRLAAAQPPPWLEADRSGATSGPPLRPPGTVA